MEVEGDKMGTRGTSSAIPKESLTKIWLNGLMERLRYAPNDSQEKSGIEGICRSLRIKLELTEQGKRFSVMIH